MNQIFVCSICQKNDKMIIKNTEDEMKDHMNKEHGITNYKNVPVLVEKSGGFAG